jgi:putative NADH-flavin reductase
LARCLIIGCGCRGRSLAGELIGRGHAVRGTTRDPGNVATLEAVGAQATIGDPDRIATLAGALDHVSVICILLGSARGAPEQLAALHGSRLEMLLSRVLDTTVRGVVYEAAGSVEAPILAAGAAHVRDVCEGSHIPFALLQADPNQLQSWLNAATAGVEEVLFGAARLGSDGKAPKGDRQFE